MSVTTRPAARPQPRIDAFGAGAMLLLCSLWGVQQVAAKVAIAGGIPPILQVLIRSCVAGPLVLGWLFLRQGRAGIAQLIARDGTFWPGLLTAVLFVIEFVLLFEGIQLISAGQAIVILYTAAFFTALGAHVLIPNERLRLINVAGLVLAFAGIAATFGGSGEGVSLVGGLLVLGAAAGWGFTTVVVKASGALMRVRPEKVLAYQLLGSIPMLLIATIVSGQLHIPDATPIAWLSIAYQSVVVTFASYLVWFWLIGRYPAGRLAAFSFLTPLFGVIAGAALLGETVTPMLVAGLVCVGAGLRLVNR